MKDRIEIDGKVLRIVQGDITRADTEAIVNAAGESLSMGGGVAGAILRAGGPSIQEEAFTKAPIPTGEAVLTTGGRLPALYVIHAVGPRGPGARSDVLLEKAVRSALRVAEEHGIRSVAFPAISTGIFGYPMESCARIMTRVAVEWLRDPAHRVREIRIVLYDWRAYREFETALAAFTGESD